MKSSKPKSEDSLAKVAQPLMRFGAKPVWGLCLVWLLTVGGGRAQEPKPSEYQLKAAFLFNFAKFVEWPPEAFTESSPFVIGILGQNPFVGADLEMLRHQTINKRPLEIKEFRSPPEATNCHILFISTSEKMRLPKILESLGKARVLTVGETEDFTETGGMIRFVWDPKARIRFYINNEAAKNADLKISSKLLSLALRLTH